MNQSRSSFEVFLLFTLVSLGFFFEALLRSSINSIFHLLRIDFNTSQIGAIAAAFFIAYALFQFVAGYLLDRIHLQKVLALGLAIVSIATLLMMSKSFVMLLVARALMGMGAAGLFISGSYLIQSIFSKKNAGFFLGMYNSIGFLGGFVANLPFLMLVEHAGLRVAWSVCAAFGVLLLFGVACLWQRLIVKKPESDCNEISRHSMLPKFSHKMKRNIYFVFLIGLTGGLLDIATGVFGGMWGHNFLHSAKHLQKSESSFLSSLVFIGYMIGTPVFGYLFSRTRHLFLYVCFCCLFLSGCYWLLIYYFTNVYLIASALLMIGFLAGQNIFAFRLPFMFSQRHAGFLLAVANFTVVMMIALLDLSIPSVAHYMRSIVHATSLFALAALVAAAISLLLYFNLRIGTSFVVEDL